MRKISTKKITDAVTDLAIKANIFLRSDLLNGLKKALRAETDLRAKNILKTLIENADIAKNKRLPICQDTGMALLFCEIGQQAYISGDIDKAINDGVKKGYAKGFLRKSVVGDPLLRKNTDTNTPSVIHYSFIKGDKVKLTLLPKGFGSENASRTCMLNPTDTEEEILEFVQDVVASKGKDACPPLVIGIGIGGTLDKAASLSKEALLLPITKSNSKKHLSRLEKRILEKINQTGIGPAGIGGKTTCLGVNILDFPTHIAGVPVAINISCHALRSASCTI